MIDIFTVLNRIKHIRVQLHMGLGWLRSKKKDTKMQHLYDLRIYSVGNDTEKKKSVSFSIWYAINSGMAENSLAQNGNLQEVFVLNCEFVFRSNPFHSIWVCIRMKPSNIFLIFMQNWCSLCPKWSLQTIFAGSKFYCHFSAFFYFFCSNKHTAICEDERLYIYVQKEKL